MLINKTKDSIIAKEVYLAYKFWPKLKGLQFKKDISSDFGYVLFNCKSIHTCFMRFNLDAAFVAYAVIEMKAGNLKVDIGDKVGLKLNGVM